jgi:hypothetical protein
MGSSANSGTGGAWPVEPAHKDRDCGDGGAARELDGAARELLARFEAAWAEQASRAGQAIQDAWAETVRPRLEREAAALAARTRAEAGPLARPEGHGQASMERLNEAVRRVCACGTREAVCAALVEGAARFARRAAVFSLEAGRGLRLERDSEGAALAEPVALERAPAFQAAVEGSGAPTTETRERAEGIAAAAGEPVVAMATATELSEAIAAALSPVAGARAFLFPLTSAGKAAGVLYAEADGGAPGWQARTDTSALEILAAVASARWTGTGREPAVSREPENAARWDQESIQDRPDRLVQLGPPGVAGAQAGASRAASALVASGGVRNGWEPADRVETLAKAAEGGGLTPEEELKHARARRYARVQVAEIQLYKPEAIRHGSAERALYDALKEEIDRCRTVFGAMFLHNCPSMTDYFHTELLETLAGGNASLLGENYPGPLA